MLVSSVKRWLIMAVGSFCLSWTLKLESGCWMFGCGYGPLGLTLAKAQGVTATMVDINQLSLGLGSEECWEESGICSYLPVKCFMKRSVGHFDHIISNPPIRAGKRGCTWGYQRKLWAFDRRRWFDPCDSEEARSAQCQVKMEAIFGNCEIVKKDKGYYILRSEK